MYTMHGLVEVTIYVKLIYIPIIHDKVTVGTTNPKNERRNEPTDVKEQI